MSSFKLCSNGHYFQESFEKCPFCPSNNYYYENEVHSDKLQTNTNEFVNQFTVSGNSTTFSENQTDSTVLEDFENKKKLVGWLVTYSHNPKGTDFKIFEGNNLVGNSPNCHILIDYDPLVSQGQLTINYQRGVFYFSHEFPNSVVFLNETVQKEGTLTDGDNIKIGNTLFKFKTAF